MLDITISGKELAVGIAVLAGLLLAVIYALRRYLAQRSTDPKVKEIIHPAARNKAPAVDALRWHNTVLRGGLTFSLAFVILAFGWTTYESEVFIPEYEVYEEIMETVPPTAFPKPPPPPLPPPTIETVPDEEPVEDPPFIDTYVEPNDVLTDIARSTLPDVPPSPVAPPPPLPPTEEKPLKFAEQMPRFLSPECESIADEKELKQCAQREMLQFIYKQINYPAIARENNVQGTVVIRFIVSKTGEVENAEILRDTGAGCGAEALRVVNKMPKWKPGRQGGRNVPVYFNLPIRFVLE